MLSELKMITGGYKCDKFEARKGDKMRKAIIVDIDGTLANIEHRRHFVQGDKKDWKSFFESMIEDTVNGWCARLMGAMANTCHNILLVSGRSGEYREFTKDWLATNSIYYDELWMREEGDCRPDVEIKKEIYHYNIKDKYEVLFVVDDRQRVVNMWREIGLVCLQCADGNY